MYVSVSVSVSASVSVSVSVIYIYGSAVMPRADLEREVERRRELLASMGLEAAAMEVSVCGVWVCEGCVCVCVCVLILLFIYMSSCCYICVLILIESMGLYAAAMQLGGVSSYCYLYICPLTAIYIYIYTLILIASMGRSGHAAQRVRILSLLVLLVQQYKYWHLWSCVLCTLAAKYVSSYCYICLSSYCCIVSSY
jgi:hypothetical protein